MIRKQYDPLDKLKAAPRKEKDGNAKGQRLRAAQRSEKLDKYANFLEPQNVEEYSTIKLELVQAGYHSKNAVRMYYLAQFTLGILGRRLCIVEMQQGDVSSKDLMMIDDPDPRRCRLYGAEILGHTASGIPPRGNHKRVPR